MSGSEAVVVALHVFNTASLLSECLTEQIFLRPTLIIGLLVGECEKHLTYDEHNLVGEWCPRVREGLFNRRFFLISDVHFPLMGDVWNRPKPDNHARVILILIGNLDRFTMLIGCL